jgi:hypothetical protein
MFYNTGSMAQSYKTFYFRNYECLYQARVFVLVKPHQLSLKFVGWAMSLL